MSVVLLNVAVIGVIIAIAGGLTLIAAAMIIISLIRHFSKKKQGIKTPMIGMWIGIAMLVLPWIVVIYAVTSVKLTEKEYNHVDGPKLRNEVVQAFLDKDADTVYSLFAPNVISECGITKEDIQEYMDSTNIEDRDFERYTSVSGPDNSDYRPTEYLYHGGGSNRPESETERYAEFNMAKINAEEETIYFAIQTGDKEDANDVGIHYIVLTNNGSVKKSIGTSETWAYYPTDEVQEEIDRLKEEWLEDH